MANETEAGEQPAMAGSETEGARGGSSFNPLETETIDGVTTPEEGFSYESVNVRQTPEFKPGLVIGSIIALALVAAVVIPLVLAPFGEVTFPAFTYLWALLVIVAIVGGFIYEYWVEQIENAGGSR